MDKTTPKYELEPETKLFLRQQAEGIVRARVALPTESVDVMAPAAARALVHELQVHQIELEMQNEELRRTQLQLDAARARYFALFDLAPVGYCTVSEQGLIVESNIAMASLLGIARSKVVGQRFSRFILTTFQDTFYLYRKRLFETGQAQTCELKMTKDDGTHIWVCLTTTAAQSEMGTPLQRVVLIDITDAKTMAAAMQESEARYRDLLNQQGKS
ncbi:MAG: PAS domain-containing protein [Burkholderiaceae bacterium]